jgi:D-arabinan exo alpha-(1,3)/(1,5)-arabinofuranosidase (non-reducing end)
MKMFKQFSVLLIFVFLSTTPALAQTQELYTPTKMQWGSTTGWDERNPGVPGWVPETIYQQTFNKKYIELSPEESYTIADVEGPGIINRIFFTIIPRPPKNNYRALVIKIYWDDEENPSVLSPLGDFFGAPFGKYVEYDSALASMQGGGMVCRFHMPFKKRARIVIENGWTDKSAPIFYGVNWYKTPDLPEDVLYFHSLWKRENPTTDGEPYTVADIKGDGKFIGLQLYLQNLSTFWYKDFNSLMQPEGFGMGNLEGWEEIFINGKIVQHGTGTEEYFNAGAYFSHAPYNGFYEGVRMRSYLTGRTSTYRFNVLDPIPFKNSFKMVWHHGPLSSIKSDYASVAYWYQTEPHKPHEIPGLEERFITGTVNHSIQTVLIWPLVYGNKLINDIVFE